MGARPGPQYKLLPGKTILPPYDQSSNYMTQGVHNHRKLNTECLPIRAMSNHSSCYIWSPTNHAVSYMWCLVLGSTPKTTPWTQRNGALLWNDKITDHLDPWGAGIHEMLKNYVGYHGNLYDNWVGFWRGHAPPTYYMVSHTRWCNLGMV